ncbi:MAG TPA: hypothetical protein VHV75_07810 [Solirubrobacteraceae bacterium]|jgi:hypothetical protein|nr:hypothetical protein [Solirubrobacteraceae bacterium]
MDLPAERRLGYMKLLSCPPKMQLLGDGDEASYLREIKLRDAATVSPVAGYVGRTSLNAAFRRR